MRGGRSRPGRQSWVLSPRAHLPITLTLQVPCSNRINQSLCLLKKLIWRKYTFAKQCNRSIDWHLISSLIYNFPSIVVRTNRRLPKFFRVPSWFMCLSHKNHGSIQNECFRVSQNLEAINTCPSLDNCLRGLRKSFQVLFFAPGYYLPSPQTSSLLTRILKKKECEGENLQYLTCCTMFTLFSHLRKPNTQSKYTKRVYLRITL